MSEGPIVTGRLRLKDETGATLDAMSTKFNTTFKDIGSVAGGIIAAEFGRNVVGAIEDVGRTATEQAAAFELATARIIAATGLTGEEAEALRRTLEATAKTLGVEFGAGATGAMEAMEALVKAGLEGEEATEALAGVLQLAAIEGINTASAANMVVAAMTMYSLSAEEATRVVDGFVKASAAGIDTAAGYALGLANVGSTASTMGFSLEESLAALVQIDASQKDAAKSGTYLNRMLLNLAEKSDDAGLSIYNADGSMRSLDEIVGQIRGKVQGFGEDQKAVNEWLGMFDTRAQKAIIALVNYDGTVAETQTQLGEMATAQDQVNVILGTYEGQMAKVQAQQEIASIGAGEFTTKVSLLGAQFTASLGPVGLFASALGPPMLQGVIQGLTVTMIPKLIAALGSGGLTGALSGVSGALPGIAGMIGAAGPLGLALVGIGAAVGLFALAWKNNWFGIRDKTKEAVDAIGGAFKGLQDWLGDLGRAWSGFWKGAAEDAEKGADKITDSSEKIEFGESPGGLRDVIAAVESLGDVWNRTVSGLKPISGLGIPRVEKPSSMEEVEQIIRRRLVEAKFPEPESVVQLVHQRLREVEAETPGDLTQVIRQVLEEVEPSLPEPIVQRVIQEVVEAETRPPEDLTQIIRQKIISVEASGIGDLGLGEHYHPTAGPGFEPGRGGGSVTLVFEDGAIQFIQPRLDTTMDRRALAREMAEMLGKEMMMRR